MFTFRSPHIVMMGGGLDFHFRILLLTKYQAHVQVQMESYKLLSLSLSEEPIENKVSIRMLLEGRRRRFIRQTNRKQTKTIQTMIHTGRTINRNRFDFPLPEVIAVDMLTGRIVTMMREYFIETYKRVVAEEIVAEEIVGGQSIRIFTRVVERHLIGLCLRSI